MRENKVKRKKNQSIFLPLMTLVNESHKELCFCLLEDLPLDLCSGAPKKQHFKIQDLVKKQSRDRSEGEEYALNLFFGDFDLSH